MAAEAKPRVHRFYQEHNQATRIDQFDELSDLAVAALRSFFRRMGAPQVLDEVVLPLFHEGDSQVFATVRDRPWPPWGLGARHLSAVCQTHLVGDETFGVSPVYVTDEDVANIGLIAALYKEVLEWLAANPRAEVNYLVVEGSTLVHHCLTQAGCERTEDVFLTERARYFTYRAVPARLLAWLGLEGVATPDLLAHEVPPETLLRNAQFHNAIQLGSRAEWTFSGMVASELIQLVRGGHFSKPGGVPTGTGRFAVDPADLTRVLVSYENFLTPADHKQLLEYILTHEAGFSSSTVSFGPRGGAPLSDAVINEKIRRSRTLDDLGRFGPHFTESIKQHLQEVLGRLRHPPFEIGRIEIQATASNDGDYFRMHQDADEQSTREMSFVYFFYREPRRFSGGELRIFETELINSKPVPVDRSQTLVPRQNLMLFFPSRHEHEVLPVRVPTKAFADSRFTINGWIHRK